MGGLLLLFLFSSAEETAMKGLLYSGLNRDAFSKVLVATAFVLMHLLNLTIFFTYSSILPFYVAYLFLYQVLSLYLYDRYSSVAFMSVIHFSVNAGILLAGGILH